MKPVLALGALVAASVVNAEGNAVVINNCPYEVGYQNTPASPQSTVPPPKWNQAVNIDGTLQTGDKYTFPYTALWNTSGLPGDGWSIKMWMPDSSVTGAILQFETTVHNDGTLWYDLSAVNGNPWHDNRTLTSSNTGLCDPNPAYYRYATDDANGMQQGCPDSVDTILTLCANMTGSASDSSSAAAPVDTQTSLAATQPAPATQPTTSSQVVPTSPTTMATVASPTAAAPAPSSSTTQDNHWGHGWAGKEAVHTTAPAPPTGELGVDGNGNLVVVTEVSTLYEDQTSTVYWPAQPTANHRHRRHAM